MKYNFEDVIKSITPEDLLEILNRKEKLLKVSLKQLETEYLEFLGSSVSGKYIESHKSSNKHLFEYFDKNIAVSEITKSICNDFIKLLKEKVPSGWLVYFRNYRAFFNYALQMKYIQSNPFADIVLPKKQQKLVNYITADELDNINAHIENITIRCISYVAFYTGMRRGEIVNLRWGNINFDSDTISVGDEYFTTKTRRARVIPMLENVKAKLLEIKPASPKKDDYVFCKDNGFPYNQEYVTHIFKRAVIETGLDDKIHFHTLRHSTASNLVQRGVSLYLVKEILGHSTITTTEIYSHLNINSKVKAMKNLLTNKKVN